ncbi:phage tail protein [Erwinia sp. AnSW2-5]|uniref:phage tail-collar fiber domain-containing protein n=1 Tax=Erwinia sp. AnSW2-5 TaxID=3367692 RepID=UPI003858C70D
MSQTVITKAFERLKAQQAANGSIVTLDEFVFANVPDLNITDPINRDESWPAGSQITHRQAVSKTGMVNENAVVYSVVLGADTGDFEFNWVGLVHKSSNTVAMIVHAPLQKKIKTAAGQQGNVLTRSFLMEYNGASQQTQIITPADTWQIDFTARLAGMDERTRLENIDIWANAGFINDGFLVTKSGSQYSVKAGAGYVSGLRAELLATQDIVIAAKPSKVWVDVCWRGTLSSEWRVETKITVADALADYYIGDEKHYVFALAQINADGSVTDLRPHGNKTDRDLQPSGTVKALQELAPEAKKLVWFGADKALGKTPLSDYARTLLEKVSAEETLKYFGLSDYARQMLAQENTGELLDFLGLKDLPFMMKYGCTMVGELIAWPLAKMPHEIWPDMTMVFIPYIAQSFDPERYPLLAQLHPAHVLPADMRAEWVRGWDNGRGSDPARVLMSAQGDASRPITGMVEGRTSDSQGRVFGGNPTGVFTVSGQASGSTYASATVSSALGTDRYGQLSFNSALQVPTAAENRTRNVAWHFIVRAK